MRLNKRLIVVLLAVIAVIGIGLYVSNHHASHTGGGGFAPATHHVGDPSLYPNAALTPGAVFPNVTEKDVCVVGYTETVRDVSEADKKEVFRRYGIPWSEHSGYEVDHFISLELGGSNDLSNLWPEPYDPKPGARQKDVVETWLHRQVCQGKMTLREAQEKIAGDWYAVYLDIKQHRRH